MASNGVNGSRRTFTKSGTCSSGSGIQGDFNLNNFEDGILSSAFMVGLLVASPIFASLAKSVNPFRLIGVGLSVWTVAAVGCGFSFNFWSITICRMFVGVGEASFISLAAPFIDDNAPVAQVCFFLLFYVGTFFLLGSGIVIMSSLDVLCLLVLSWWILDSFLMGESLPQIETDPCSLNMGSEVGQSDPWVGQSALAQKPNISHSHIGVDDPNEYISDIELPASHMQVFSMVARSIDYDNDDENNNYYNHPHQHNHLIVIIILLHGSCTHSDAVHLLCMGPAPAEDIVLSGSLFLCLSLIVLFSFYSFSSVLNLCDTLSLYQKTAWLAIFYMCIPSGIAVGYVYGGLVGDHFSWRYAFWGEAILMLPFAILAISQQFMDTGFAPAKSKKTQTAVETIAQEGQDTEALNGKDGALSMKADSKYQSSNTPSGYMGFETIVNYIRDGPDYRLNNWVDLCCFASSPFHINSFYCKWLFSGYISYNFVIGAYSYWGPKAGYNIYNMQYDCYLRSGYFVQSKADLIFGGITIVCGILGTIAGGCILDLMTSTISNAFKVGTHVRPGKMGKAGYQKMSSEQVWNEKALYFFQQQHFFGAICCFSAFCFKSLYGFLALFSIGELLVFATQEIRYSSFCSCFWDLLYTPCQYSGYSLRHSMFAIAGTCQLCMPPLCETKFASAINGYVYCLQFTFLVMFLPHHLLGFSRFAFPFPFLSAR
ncbi:putative sphingolipid transporter spinster-like 2 [Vitis vinifera]|uniref:Putative sphingolipid transporter spinster-like 2 n=1 Tax=Vitis vinifera TaxID=29760 RepID=A0A438EHF5_VITVI|nr:putative sphingolipid transporter spinster-like 2 [Vitis vinifera]